ncbi:hypothetical protein, variant [Exophiala oligosperma]|nr:hypothetical protein, variant [Exophiala oligosperma]KIW36187.1 hypothetical protein, variant [Exophiala oligosperma]
MEWRRFRDMQDKKRSYYVPRNRFQEYQDSVRESQTDAGWNYDLRVLEDRHQQNRLEDWNEFRALYYRRLKACEKRVPRAEEDLSMYQRKFEDAQARLTDVITDPQVLYGRFDDIRASEKEVMEAKSRVESAEKASQVAKQNRSKGKSALMRIALQEVASARDNLKKVSGSEELRSLREGYELHITRQSMIRSKAELSGAERNVQRWKVFLKWIDGQYPVIAGECGLFARGASRVSFQPAKGIEDPRSQKERPQARQRRRKNPRSVLSPNISSKVSKSSKFSKRRVTSPSFRPTITTPLAGPLQEDGHCVLVVAPAQQGDIDHSRESRLSPCLTKSTPQPTRSSARIAERKRCLQDSNAPSETLRTMSKDVHELSKVKPRKEKSLRRATTKSGERLKRRHPSKPQGVTKRKGRPR